MSGKPIKKIGPQFSNNQVVTMSITLFNDKLKKVLWIFFEYKIWKEKSQCVVIHTTSPHVIWETPAVIGLSDGKMTLKKGRFSKIKSFTHTHLLRKVYHWIGCYLTNRLLSKEWGSIWYSKHQEENIWQIWPLMNILIPS